MSHLTKDNPLFLDACQMGMVKQETALCLQEAIKGNAMHNSLSTEEVDEMAARLRVVEPDPAPLDTPLPKQPTVIFISSSAHDDENIEYIVKRLQQRTFEMNVIDIRLRDDESSKESSEAIASSVKEFQPHILHFSCQGSYQRSCLLKNDTLNDIDLSIIFQADETSIKLVVINACHSGGATHETKSFFPLAKALIEKGVPAVVTMWSYKSTDRCSLMTQTFYKALEKGKTVRSAAYDTRKAVYDEDAPCEPVHLYERTVFGCRKAAFPRKRVHASK